MTKKGQAILDFLLNNIQPEGSRSRSLEAWLRRAECWLELPHGPPPEGFREACLEALREIAQLDPTADEEAIRAFLRNRKRLPKTNGSFGRPNRTPWTLNPNSSLRRNALLVGLRSPDWFGACSARP
jgi:hypothetical protein